MNLLKVNQQQAILSLLKQGWSQRRIARELRLDRGTVGKYARSSKSATNPQTGSEDDSDSKPATNPQTGSPGPSSSCEPWRGRIEKAWSSGLSVQRIYQDLVVEEGFKGGYYSVYRFVRGLPDGAPELPFRRMECEPGLVLQVDFGQGAWVVEDGKRRRPHLFRCVLSHCRKGYSEVVWKQDTESFVRCLENAFREFGGVTATVVIDNLKAGVIKADWFDPDLNPKLEEFARHYGTCILPTKPAMPRHKGKVESAVNYAQENALKARKFESLGAQNAHLANWERKVADTRIHGTTRLQVGKVFDEVEKATLKPLPESLFPSFIEAPRSVHRDGHVEFQKAYYSAPPEYAGQKVWVRCDGRLVRILNRRREQIALHAHAQPGKFTTAPEHIHSRKRHIIERGVDYLLDQCRLLGPFAGTWAEGMHQTRGPQSLRVMQGLLQLARNHPADRIERAAKTAAHHGAWRLRDLKRLLNHPDNVVQLDFLETHPLIRSLEAYRVELSANLEQEP